MGEYNQFLHKADFDYELITKTTDDVIEQCNFENDKDKVICKDIITHLHKTAKKYIEADKVANIPYIGCLRKSPVNKVITENKDHIKHLAKSTTLGEFQFQVSNIVNKAKSDAKKEDEAKMLDNKVKAKNRKLYDKIAKDKGVVAAINFIKMLQNLEVIEYDEEVEEMYRRLSNG